jgi:L-asparaginase II
MTNSNHSEDVVVTDRAGIIENRYLVHAAVVDAEGHLIYAVGDPDRMTLARSAAKPVQALAIVETGALECFGFTEQDLALICASHSSEDRHISKARSMLDRIGCKEADLRCGGHPAVSEKVNHTWIQQGFSPTPICNNCSGKHAGMLAGAKSIGADTEDYHMNTHPMQKRVIELFEDFCGGPSDSLRWAIDGCNLPAPAAPLQSIARIYALFAASAEGVATRLSPNRAHNAARIFKAMTSHPDLVAGEGRFCTELMRAYNGLLIGKIGAEACYGVAVRQFGDAKSPIGIYVKIEDGNINILYSAVLEILAQLGIGMPTISEGLAKFYSPQIRNTAGVVCGSTSHVFQLRPVTTLNSGRTENGIPETASDHTPTKLSNGSL